MSTGKQSPPAPEPDRAPEARYELSVILPAWNEAGRIGPYLHAIRSYLANQGLSAEILVVDDGSTDGTATLCAGEPVRVIALDHNVGKGHAVAAGVMASAGRTVLIADADGSAAIEQLALLRTALEAGADIAIGSRFVSGAQILTKRPWSRRAVSRAGNVLTRTLLGLPYSDTQCGFKLYRRDAARVLFGKLRTPGYGYEFEILRRARGLGLRVTEVPIRWSDRAGSKLTGRAVLRTLGEMLLILIRRT